MSFLLVFFLLFFFLLFFFVVLLIEDEPADAHLVKVSLRENRILCEVHDACDGVEGLAFLRRETGYT